ncbi:MAG: hypothetical protein KAQ98_04070 [Bacteriovoracaceae bacterium]|nr:hypothetical protein [Bacteriovoracaceae bacterium]
MKLNKLLITTLLITIIAVSASGQEEKVSSITFGPVSIGENRIPIQLTNFQINTSFPGREIKVELKKDSFQWIRYKGVLLIPRARIRIIMKAENHSVHLKYQGQSIIPQTSKKNKLIFSEFFVSLFQPDNIEIFVSGKKSGFVSISPRYRDDQNKENTHLIDYSCSPYHVEIKGLDHEYISVGCMMNRIGGYGHEKALLEVYWTSAEYKLEGGGPPPYVATFVMNNPVKMTVVNKKGEKRNIEIHAKIPKRLNRLKTAIGFGPYIFDTRFKQTNRRVHIAPAAMLYANLNLSQNTSLRAFDALMWETSFFNNAGIYFAYNLGTALDGRLLFIPLLGFQALAFRYDNRIDTYHKFIFPQGFEIVYKHPFGLENYALVYGMFISTSSADDDYQNLWVRFGKKIFWEINYINWSDDTKKASMWGLSIGIPFVKML